MKKLFIILSLLIIHHTFAQVEGLTADSLRVLLSKAIGTDKIDISLELSKIVGVQSPDEAEKLIDEAIIIAKELNYEEGLSEAYQQKGRHLYDKEKVLSGVLFFKKAFDINEKLKSDEKAAESLYGLAQGLARINRNQESIDTLDYILNQYKDAIQARLKSDILHLQSRISNSLNEQDASIGYLKQSIEIEKDNQLLDKLGKSYIMLGSIYYAIGNNNDAYQYYQLCEKTARKAHDTLLISQALHNSANIYLSWGLFDEALNLFLESKNFLSQASYENEIVATLTSIASVYFEIGDYDKSKYYYKKSLYLAEKNNQTYLKGIIYNNLGEVLFAEKKYDSALNLLELSLKYEMQDDNTLGIAESKMPIGIVYSELGQYNLAFKYYNEADSIFKIFGSKQDQAHLYSAYAKTYEKMGNDSLSIIYYEKCINLSNNIKERNLLNKAYKQVSNIYEKRKDYHNALIYYKLYDILSDSLFNKNTTIRLEHMNLELENQERIKALSQLESEQKLLRLQSKNRTIFLSFAIIFLVLAIVFFYWRFRIKKRSEVRITKQYNTLLESEQKIKALLNASFDSTLLINLNGFIITINNNTLNGFFTNPKSMIQKDLFSFFSEENQNTLKKLFSLVLNSKAPSETILKEKNKFVLNIKISPVLDHSNQIGSLAFYIKDVTQIEKDKKAKETMEKQLIQTQKMETIGTLAGGIAHDFNNSLATIQGYASMAIEDIPEDNRIHRYLTNMQKAIDLSRNTVKKLMIYSRSKDIIFNKINLNNLINDSIDLIMGSMPKNIAIEYPNKNNDIELLGDKNQLTQIILNICTNAFHAIGDKKGLIKISIKSNEKVEGFFNTKMLIINIEDDGEGMDIDTQKRIFEPFYTTKDVGKGTGLGLSVVVGIIKQHHGKIEVHSKLDFGTTFSIYLPQIS